MSTNREQSNRTNRSLRPRNSIGSSTSSSQNQNQNQNQMASTSNSASSTSSSLVPSAGGAAQVTPTSVASGYSNQHQPATNGSVSLNQQMLAPLQPPIPAQASASSSVNPQAVPGYAAPFLSQTFPTAVSAQMVPPGFTPNPGEGPSNKRARPNISTTPYCDKASKNDRKTISQIEINCPICFELLREPHITMCGHTFCLDCINQSLKTLGKCPKCFSYLDPLPHLVPNYVVEEMVRNEKKKRVDLNVLKTENSTIKEFFEEKGDSLTSGEIEFIIEELSRRKAMLESESQVTDLILGKAFLQQLQKHKEMEIKQLQKESEVIQKDLKDIEEQIDDLEKKEREEKSTVSSSKGRSSKNGKDSEIQMIFSQMSKGSSDVSLRFKDRQRRMITNFKDLSECYFNERQSEIQLQIQDNETNETSECPREGFGNLRSFTKCLSRYTQFSKFRPLASLNYSSDIFNTASIVSSIEFDKDNEYFAIAGTTKRIKVYDYNCVIKDIVDLHYPSMEMSCNSKVACVTWNGFEKALLASSNYEGSVILWNVNTCQKVRTFQEHEKRCWSVDFNRSDTKLLASGSDDSRVKLWSTNVGHSVASLEAKANVCCVKFNPSNCYHLAYGSADHCIHYYDLRHPKSPIQVFKGHKKAVSYVKFLDPSTLVSASTDSQLKMWDVNDSICRRSFQGHINEKNFVGLATNGDFITCGSENNSLYLYYKGLSRPIFRYDFGLVRSLLEREPRDPEEAREFVSAVCWRNGTNIVLGANSQGAIKVLELE